MNVINSKVLTCHTVLYYHFPKYIPYKIYAIVESPYSPPLDNKNPLVNTPLYTRANFCLKMSKKVHFFC